MLTDARRANLARLLKPRHIVFMGGERAAWAVRICRAVGFTGELFAVHPTRTEFAGIPCAKHLADLPVAPDAAFLAVPAAATTDVVRTLAEIGAGGAVCYAAGFAEMGEAGAARQSALVAAAGDLALVGPNCFGIVNYVNGGSLWSVPYLPDAGPRGAAVIGQSGNVCINLTMNQRSVPFSYVISAGNQAVLGFEDYIEVLADDPNVTAIGLFLEGLRDVPAFAAACHRAMAQGKPVVAFRVGVSELGAQLAASHTSSLAGQNDLYTALFRQLGVLEAASVPQFLEMLKLASLGRRPAGRRLAVFSSSGGDNGMAADFASLAGLALPPPTPEQAHAIRAYLPDYGHVSNPLDFTAGYWGAEQILTPMFGALLREGYDQAMLVVDHPRPEVGVDIGKPVAAMVRAMGAACRAAGVPGVVASVNPESMPESMRRQVIDEGLVPLQGLHDAGPVLGAWTTFCLRSQTEEWTPISTHPPEGAASPVNEAEAKGQLSAYGVRVPTGCIVSLEDIRAGAFSIDRPMVLKALHAELLHKTDVGGVSLGLASTADVQAAAERMVESVGRGRPDLHLDRFLLEEMVTGAVAELLVGVKRDPMFGLVLVVGMGGVAVELLRDVARLILPAGRDEIERALTSLRTFPLLDGYRGRPRADLGAAVAAIEAVARFAIARRHHLIELDVNPLLVLPAGGGAVAADAVLILR
ncbi:MAG: acetate--CoA ligase family protein [Hyphomicrobiales bacterium]